MVALLFFSIMLLWWWFWSTLFPLSSSSSPFPPFYLLRGYLKLSNSWLTFSLPLTPDEERHHVRSAFLLSLPQLKLFLLVLLMSTTLFSRPITILLFSFDRLPTTLT